jgi:hypothetical protein
MSSQDKKFTICFCVAVLSILLISKSIIHNMTEYESKIKVIHRHVIGINLEKGKSICQTIDVKELENND